MAPLGREDAAESEGSAVLPIGINPTSIGVSAAWWLEAVRGAEDAGFGSAWIWDHFVSRGRLGDPVLECWSMLAAAAVATRRIRLGSFVTNVMNRHPAVLARVVATVADLSGGRVELGLGIGGHPAEHAAYGIPFPAPTVRAAHLEEAMRIVRLLLGGGPADFAGRYYALEAAHAFPAPTPMPRILLAGATAEGARRAARLADGWICFATDHDRLRPVFREALGEIGRSEQDVAVLVAVEADEALAGLDTLAERWSRRGVSELVVHDVGPRHLRALLSAAAAAGTLYSGPVHDRLRSRR